MVPVIVLDSNALFGARALLRSDLKKLLALSRMGLIMLVVPDIVVQELGRQWHLRLSDAAQMAKRGLRIVSKVLAEIGGESVSVDLPSHGRDKFIAHMKQALSHWKATVPVAPTVTSDVLVAKDLDGRKPFSSDGKGLRDALIWETVSVLCRSMRAPETLVVFVTANHKDFCVDKNLALHPDLAADLPEEQRFEVVRSLADLEEHPVMMPILVNLDVIENYFTVDIVNELAENAFAELIGSDVFALFGEYDRDGIFSAPFNTVLESPTVDAISSDTSTLEFEVFRSDDDKLTLRVTVDCETYLDGYVQKADYYPIEEEGEITVFEDWNSHMYRAGESRDLTFELSAEFEIDKPETAQLSIDSIET